MQVDVGRSALLAVLLGALAFPASPSNNPFEKIAPPSRAEFGQQSIARGASLAALGNCSGCHTVPDKPPYSGGVPVKTPFGTVYGSNITPEAGTGIGNWSEAAFVRAMREGIARDGRHLYPAFPYDHFTLAASQDLSDLYAFVMTRAPVRAQAPRNRLAFPFNVRPLMAAWNGMFLDRRPFVPDATQTAQWNRGAYLTQGLAHCGACHTPRNALGAEQRDKALAGGEAGGWYAPALNADSPSPQPWSEDQLVEYLRTGVAARHAIAGGPMQDVVANLARASEADVRAIAVYVLSRMAPPGAELAAATLRRARSGLAGSALTYPADPAMQLGAAVYADACASCHDLGRRAGSQGALRMPLAVALYEPDPRSFLRIVREGVVPPDGEPGRWMPAYGKSLTDAQLTALAAYLRSEAAQKPAWPQLARVVAESTP